MEPSVVKLRELIAEYIRRHPANERQLADELRISLPTLHRWMSGANLPVPLIAQKLVAHLQRILGLPAED